ncbi:hypothetical protein FBU31_001596, partial [Coemansia sp. 'formosensis']
AILGGEFAALTKLNAADLCQQQNLISKMHSKCPKQTSRWLDMGDYCHWLMDHYIQLQSYFSGGNNSSGSGSSGSHSSCSSGNVDIDAVVDD